MSKRREARLPLNLSQLQNLIKRDPPSYRYEFDQQLCHFDAQLELFLLNPTVQCEALCDLVNFLAQVSPCYPAEAKTFPMRIVEILERHSTALRPELRLSLCKALMLYRSRSAACKSSGYLSTEVMYELFFMLISRCNDAILRKTLLAFVVSDLRRLNAKNHDQRINAPLQRFMFERLQFGNARSAKAALDVLIEMYRRQIWRTERLVNVIGTYGCFHSVTKILVASLRFFTGVADSDGADGGDGDSSDDDGAGESLDKKSEKEVLISHRVGKKTKKRARKMKKAIEILRQKKKQRKNVAGTTECNFSAIHLLRDPQELAERLFKQLQNCHERFEVKLMMADLIGRLVGIHQLFLFPFYPFLQRYLRPHQREVTKLLTYLAQASHDLVPPEVLGPVLRGLADNFVTERNSSEVIAVGLNAIREVCARCPLAIGEDLLHDLVRYRNYKDKSVSASARSLVQLYRQLKPKMLERRDRGRPMAGKDKPLSDVYGERTVADHVSGAHILCNDSGDGGGSSGEDHDDGDGDDERQNSETMGVDDEKDLAVMISGSRILSENDLAKLRAYEAKKAAGLLKRKSSGRTDENSASAKRSKTDAEMAEPAESDSEESIPELVKLSAIERVSHSRKRDKESRLETVLAGRQDQKRPGRGSHRQNPMASTTNREKARRKPFSMVRNKVAKGRLRKSFREKQMRLRSALLKTARTAHKRR